MFIVTNREVNDSKKGFKQFGGKPNAEGTLELRLVEVTGSSDAWEVRVLPDVATQEMRELAGLPEEGEFFASDYAARMLLKQLRKKTRRRDVLFFVHGFNNDVESVVERAHHFEQTYDVEVVAFSWPANGGGVKGVASYKSDKRDALASIGALDRCIQRIGDFLMAFNREAHERIEAIAYTRYRYEAEQREAYIAEAMEKECPIRISMLLHSMGNYLFKHLLLSSTYHARELVFDNVILAAADTNNFKHSEWVDRVQCRNRLYITINEDDTALRTSRMKLGSQQRARLGHFTNNLDSMLAVYVDFTQADHVGGSHAYFEGAALENEAIRTFFYAAIHGERAEKLLDYDAAKNLYRVRD